MPPPGSVRVRWRHIYAEVARRHGIRRPRYFVEKAWPDHSTINTMQELYPGLRELVLVRDFRDIVCSITAFNAKRGFPSFGQEAPHTDAGLISLLRDQAVDLLTGFEARRDRALIVRYEDLILEPEKTLGAIFSFLDIRSTSACVEQTLDSARRWLPEVQRDHQTSPTVMASIGRWATDLPAELRDTSETDFGDLLTAFGYGPGI